MLNGVGVGSAESNGTSMWASSVLPSKVIQGHLKWRIHLLLTISY